MSIDKMAYAEATRRNADAVHNAAIQICVRAIQLSGWQWSDRYATLIRKLKRRRKLKRAVNP